MDVEPVPWHRLARCVGRGAIFDQTHVASPELPHQAPLATNRAIACCMRCPVRPQCLLDAFMPRLHFMVRKDTDTEPDPLGVYGATLPSDRRGRTAADAPEILVRAEARAVAQGLAPAWAMAEAG